MKPAIRLSYIGAAVLIAGIAAYYAAGHPMDFRVYYYTATGVLNGTGPMYGMTSGLGWPMHYRYPPLFLLLFAPLAGLPLPLGAAIWVTFKLLILVVLIRVVAKAVPAQPGGETWMLPFLLAGPYLIQELRYGNAQFYVFALAAGSLLLAHSRPKVSAASLALGICVKLWPLFFVPYLAARRQTKVVVWTLVFTTAFTLIPAVYFGMSGNVALLGQWFRQEFATQTGQDEIWFPSQSLRGVMMRYFTVIDYSQVPDSKYPRIQIAQVDPAVIRSLWLVVSACVYLSFLMVTSRRRKSEGWIESSVGFCLIGLFEPFTQKYALVILSWPAFIAARHMNSRIARRLVYVATGLALIQPLIPGAASQRLMQVLGFDFAVTLVLALALGWILLGREDVVTTYSHFSHESII